MRVSLAHSQEKSDAFVIQKMTVRDETFAYQAGALATTPGGLPLVVGTSRPAGIPLDDTETALLWRVNRGGEQLEEIALIPQPEQLLLQIDYVHSALVLENGDVFLLAQVRGSSSIKHTSLIRINKTGQVLFVSAVKFATRPSGLLLWRIVRIDERHFFLLGGTAKGALLVKVDDQGNTVWEKTFDQRQQDDVLFDGFATPGGGAVLVGGVAQTTDGRQWATDGLAPAGGCDGGGPSGKNAAGQSSPNSANRGWRGDYDLWSGVPDKGGMDTGVRCGTEATMANSPLLVGFRHNHARVCHVHYGRRIYRSHDTAWYLSVDSKGRCHGEKSWRIL